MVGMTWKDTLNASGRFFHSLSSGTSLTANVLTSWTVNLIAAILFSLAGFIALIARRPFSGLLMVILGIAMWSGYRNAQFVDHRLVAVDIKGAQKDFLDVMGKAWTHARNFDIPYIDIPGLDQWLDDSPGQKTTVAHRSLASEYEPAAHRDAPTTWRNWLHRSTTPVYTADVAPRPEELPDVIVPSAYQKNDSVQSDDLGSFLRESGIATTFPVYRNAYQTARANQLYFRPGSDIESTLKHCRYVSKGSYIKFTLDSDGFVSGCFPIVR